MIFPCKQEWTRIISSTRWGRPRWMMTLSMRWLNKVNEKMRDFEQAETYPRYIDLLLFFMAKKK